jgi:hypothetical protein
VELQGTMRFPGPYSGDTWDWMPRSQDVAEIDAQTKAANGVSRVVWELGLVLFVPLVVAGIVELALQAFSVH